VDADNGEVFRALFKEAGEEVAGLARAGEAAHQDRRSVADAVEGFGNGADGLVDHFGRFRERKEEISFSVEKEAKRLSFICAVLNMPGTAQTGKSFFTPTP
jgi:hypothetical protein